MFEVQAGKKVEVVSGGPTMAVERLDGDRALCVWMEWNRTRREWFAVATLREARPLNSGSSR